MFFLKTFQTFFDMNIYCIIYYSYTMTNIFILKEQSYTYGLNGILV